MEKEGDERCERLNEWMSERVVNVRTERQGNEGSKRREMKDVGG